MNTRRRTQKSPTIETYTLTLVGKDGLQMPIGENGAPAFHLFHNWTKACDAIADAAATVGLENIHAVAVTKTQTRNGKMELFSATHFTADEVAEIYEGETRLQPGPTVTLANGSRVNVSVPN